MRYDAPRPVKLMIALDQVERLFVEVEPERVEAFASLLRALVEAGLANVIAVLRSDTYGRFQAVTSFLALLEAHGATLDLLPPTQAELEEIVTRPVAACHPPLAYETRMSGRSLAELLVYLDAPRVVPRSCMTQRKPGRHPPCRHRWRPGCG